MPRPLQLSVLCLLLSFCFSFPATAGAGIAGAVFDAASGLPVAGATVTCGFVAVLADARGRFEAPAGCGNIAVRAPGYLRKEQDAAFPPEFRLVPFTPRALYLSFYGAGSRILRGQGVKLIEETELNALVIDIKGDRGMISYRSNIPLATEVGAQQIITLRDLPGLLQSLKAKKIYTIARIVVFKDDKLSQSRPDLAVRDAAGEVWKDQEEMAWVDPFRQEVWEYNLAIAAEAAEYGFDEIQFDYIRFPDRAGLVFSRENTQENRVRAINDFLATARERLIPYNIYLSADIFGYVCWNENDTWIGQHLETLAPHIDYLAPMLYPSGFQFGVGPYKNPVKNPYEIILLTLDRARERTGLPPVRFRPWLQAFRDYAFDRREFGGVEIQAQVQASRDFGSNGYMLWNPRNVYTAQGLTPFEAPEELEQPILKTEKIEGPAERKES
ncbi:MAG: putative glycoside hydrolase [Desulfuromonadales bacterium]